MDNDQRIAVFQRMLGDGQMPPLSPPSMHGNIPPMDPWQSSVETRLGQLVASGDRLSDRIDSNFKWMLGVYGAGFVVTIGALASGFIYLADKISGIPH